MELNRDIYKFVEYAIKDASKVEVIRGEVTQRAPFTGNMALAWTADCTFFIDGIALTVIPFCEAPLLRGALELRIEGMPYYTAAPIASIYRLPYGLKNPAPISPGLGMLAGQYLTNRIDVPSDVVIPENCEIIVVLCGYKFRQT